MHLHFSPRTQMRAALKLHNRHVGLELCGFIRAPTRMLTCLLHTQNYALAVFLGRLWQRLFGQEDSVHFISHCCPAVIPATHVPTPTLNRHCVSIQKTLDSSCSPNLLPSYLLNHPIPLRDISPRSRT